MGKPAKRNEGRRREIVSRMLATTGIRFSSEPRETIDERAAKLAAYQRFFKAGGKITRIPCRFVPKS